MKHLLYNVAHPLAESGKPIFIPFGEWPYDKTRRQRLDREHGEAIANELNARVARGEPGIPVYQGHPDVPELAAKYPDKGALGWVTKIDLANEGGREGLALTVEWDRDPGKGFKWFSPYWMANSAPDGVCVVDEIASIGLVNTPNIPEFRLANEAGDNDNNETKGKEMDREKLIQLLGLPPEATDDQILAAIAAAKEAAADKAAAEQKAEAAEADKAAAAKESGEAKAELENCRKQLEETKAALANEKAQHEKTKALKTGRIDFANAKPDGDRRAQREALVNELMAGPQKLGFSAAWSAAKARNPELFK